MIWFLCFLFLDRKLIKIYFLGAINLILIILLKHIKTCIILSTYGFTKYISMFIYTLLLSLFYNTLSYNFSNLLSIALLFSPYFYLVGDLYNMNFFWSYIRNLNLNIQNYRSIIVLFLLITVICNKYIASFSISSLKYISIILIMIILSHSYHIKILNRYISKYKISNKIVFLSFFSIVSLSAMNLWKKSLDYNLYTLSNTFADFNRKIAEYCLLFSYFISSRYFYILPYISILLFYKLNQFTLVLFFIIKYLYFDLGKESLYMTYEERKAEHILNFISKIFISLIFLYFSTKTIIIINLFIIFIWIIML